MNLLKTIKNGPSIRKEVFFPGTDTKIELKLISVADHQAANLAADALYKDNQVGFHNVNDYENEKTVQMLYRACVEPGTVDKLAESVSTFKELLTDVERDALITEYNNFNAECNPSPDTLSDEEFDKLVFDLKKKPSETVGNCFNISTLKRLCLFLASQPASLPADNGSTST